MNDTIKLILSLSLSGSLLAVVIFAVKPLIRNRLSKSIQYYVWIVVILRLVLPFSFEGSAMNNIFYEKQTISAAITENKVPSGGYIDVSTVDSSTMPKAQGSMINNEVYYSRYLIDLLNKYSLYIWLLGLIIAITTNLAGYVRFLKHLKQHNKPASEEQNRVLDSLLNGRRNLRLVRNHFVSTPMLLGILKPVIIIPDAHLSKNQLRNVLLHEIKHLKGFDIVVKWLTMIAASIHWFNPIMYFIKKEINHSCELACDEAVIKKLTPIEKQSYGDTLISLAAENKYPKGALQVTMCEEKKSLKERLIAIMNHNKKPKFTIILSAILLGFVTLGAVFLGGAVGKRSAVKVDEALYNLEDISKYKTPYLGDNSKVFALVSKLPLPNDSLKQHYISMVTDKKPYKLNVFYEGKNDESNNSEWSLIISNSSTQSILEKNAIVLFSMIGNLEELTFSVRNTPSNGKLDTMKYDTSYTFSRNILEGKYGPLQSKISENLKLIINALTDKKDPAKIDIKDVNSIEIGNGADKFIFTKDNNSVFKIIEFITAYNEAVPASDELGTTPNNEVIINFADGARISVFGGTQSFQTVQTMDGKQFNIKGDELWSFFKQINRASTIGVQNAGELISKLEESYPSIKYSKESNSLFLSGSLTVADIDGNTIEIYEYKNNQEMEQDAKTISSDGFKIGNTLVDWKSKPHFYKSGNIIVNYVGENKEIIKRVDKLMGQQFAGM